MEPPAAGNLLEIMDLARTLRQEQLFIQQEQAAFVQLNGTLETNAGTITKVSMSIRFLKSIYLILIPPLAVVLCVCTAETDLERAAPLPDGS